MSARRRAFGTFVAMGAVALSACMPADGVSGDVSRYILPPGNYGGLPTTDNSRDQLPLYDALTPLRGNVTDDDIQRFFLPQDFEPIGETREEERSRQAIVWCHGHAQRVH